MLSKVVLSYIRDGVLVTKVRVIEECDISQIESLLKELTVL